MGNKEPKPVTTAPAKEAVVKSFRDFSMKKKLDENPTVHYPFKFPGQGDTGFWLKVRSQYCKEFRDADMKAQRQISALIVANGGKVEDVDPDLMDDIRKRAFCKLVAEWNFPDELNDDNLMDFFAENEFVYDDVNNLAAQDSLFFSSPANN